MSKQETKKQQGRLELQVTGFMTLSGSAKLPNKEALVSAPEGKVKCFRKVLTDPATGEQVVITGKMVLSKNSGNISSRIAFKLHNPEVVIVDTKAKKAAEAGADVLGQMAALLKP